MSALQKFVPRSRPVASKIVEELQCLLDKSSSLVIMTGAGLSTESGLMF